VRQLKNLVRSFLFLFAFCFLFVVLKPKSGLREDSCEAGDYIAGELFRGSRDASSREKVGMKSSIIAS
jgi:hypothetical protein